MTQKEYRNWKIESAFKDTMELNKQIFLLENKIEDRWFQDRTEKIILSAAIIFLSLKLFYL